MKRRIPHGDLYVVMRSPQGKFWTVAGWRDTLHGAQELAARRRLDSPELLWQVVRFRAMEYYQVMG